MTYKTSRTLCILFLAIALAALVFSCRKDEEPNIQSITFEREYFQYSPTSVTVSGVYSYDGRIDGIKMQVGKRNDLADARAFEADIDGKDYTVEITGLQPGTEYHYCYEVDYGFSKPYKTETKTFATPADSPVVKTLEVIAIDSTTVRVNCETVSDGGVEITERGVCWNTYGNPNLDDEIIAYGSAGVGQYSCRISGLALSTKYYFRAYAKNASGIGFGEVLEFETLAEAHLPEVSTVEISNVASTTATCLGNVTNDGGASVTERGVCWSTSHNPTISGSHANSGTGTGGFTVNMTGLTANTHYYVRAYAKNSAGVSYGNEVDFTTAQNVSAPTVNTSQVTNITQTTATGGGNVTNSGGATVTERGICWSTSHNPTISGSHANSGTGTGGFTVNMTGLTANTTYYVRAYAINSAGTSYGSEVSFTTQQALTVPTVTTSQVTNITQTSATGGGNVTATGGANVTERGICWGTSHNPTTSGSHANSGTGTGSFTVNMTGLTANTTYYVRAYAINSAGTNYGSEVPFTTLSSGGGHAYVDLGLPSGLLWATCNVGANTPEDYGDYFAWGETQPKDYYDWSTYQYCNGSDNTLTKYCSNSSYGYNGFTDNLTTLQPSDDAATAQWGSGWRMPTQAEWAELLNNTTYVWMTQNGVNGRLFTATNGNSLFLPAAGYRDGTSLDDVGAYGRYWSSSLYAGSYPYGAWYLYFASGICHVGSYARRYLGQSVRPVRSASKN